MHTQEDHSVEVSSTEDLTNPATSSAGPELMESCDSTTASGSKISGLSFKEIKLRPQQHYCLFCQKPQARLPRQSCPVEDSSSQFDESCSIVNRLSTM
jgi:hypothetical protein